MRAEAAPETPARRMTDAARESPAADLALPGQKSARDRAPSAQPGMAPAAGVPGTNDLEEHSRRQRVSSAARGAVEGKLGPRVEKLRQASNVMIEEASYDPSLRFVLIAVAIFLISMFLLLLNHILG